MSSKLVGTAEVYEKESNQLLDNDVKLSVSFVKVRTSSCGGPITQKIRAPMSFSPKRVPESRPRIATSLNIPPY